MKTSIQIIRNDKDSGLYISLPDLHVELEVYAEDTPTEKIVDIPNSSFALRFEPIAEEQSLKIYQLPYKVAYYPQSGYDHELEILVSDPSEDSFEGEG